MRTFIYPKLAIKNPCCTGSINADVYLCTFNVKKEMKRILGIMGAMAEEIDEVKTMLVDVKSVEVGGRAFYSGMINGIEYVAL